MENERINKKGRKNLFFATLVCVPGPFLLVMGMLGGANTTQIADLIKRSCDLLTEVLAWLIYELTLCNFIKNNTKHALEKLVKYFTGASMCISGGVMIYVAVADFGGTHGNMYPSLFLAVTGAVINVILYLNYRSMNNAVLSIQAKLHKVKALFDIALTAILLVWILCPHGAVREYFNVFGTALISLYMIFSGIRVLEIRRKKSREENKA